MNKSLPKKLSLRSSIISKMEKKGRKKKNIEREVETIKLRKNKLRILKKLSYISLKLEGTLKTFSEKKIVIIMMN